MTHGHRWCTFLRASRRQRAVVPLLPMLLVPIWAAADNATTSDRGAPATGTVSDMPHGPVPALPVVQDINALEPIPLRREVARAEGQISDLGKSREAALAGLAAAVAEAEARAAAAARASEDAGPAPADGDAASAAAPLSPLLDPDTRAARRRAIVQRYERRLAQAHRRLERLLARQAQIDPEAPDQKRLRNAVSAAVDRP